MSPRLEWAGGCSHDNKEIVFPGTSVPIPPWAGPHSAPARCRLLQPQHLYIIEGTGGIENRLQCREQHYLRSIVGRCLERTPYQNYLPSHRRLRTHERPGENCYCTNRIRASRCCQQG